MQTTIGGAFDSQLPHPWDPVPDEALPWLAPGEAALAAVRPLDDAAGPPRPAFPLPTAASAAALASGAPPPPSLRSSEGAPVTAAAAREASAWLASLCARVVSAGGRDGLSPTELASAAVGALASGDGSEQAELFDLFRGDFDAVVDVLGRRDALLASVGSVTAGGGGGGGRGRGRGGGGGSSASGTAASLRAARAAALAAAPGGGGRLTAPPDVTIETEGALAGFRRSADSAGPLGGVDRLALPAGTTRTVCEDYEEVIVPAVQRVNEDGGAGRLAVSAALAAFPELMTAFRGVESLNRLQSAVFPTAFESAENLLVCAPTGAGKTNVALLTILREVAHARGQGPGRTEGAGSTSSVAANGSRGATADSPSLWKAVYVAPMKALAAEVVSKFGARLAPLGLSVRELTGDMNLTRAEAAATDIIVTTPEKWDVVTRKAGSELAAAVTLLIIDEIHLLHDDRGAVLESLVARTLRASAAAQRLIRLVGLSATLPNYRDVAAFLRVKEDVGLFHFDASYRPVPLSQTFIGVKAGGSGSGFAAAQKRNAAMSAVCWDKVVDSLHRGHQAMVFVHSRKETVTTARDLLEAAAEDGVGDIFIGGEGGGGGGASASALDRDAGSSRTVPTGAPSAGGTGAGGQGSGTAARRGGGAPFLGSTGGRHGRDAGRGGAASGGGKGGNVSGASGGQVAGRGGRGRGASGPARHGGKGRVGGQGGKGGRDTSTGRDADGGVPSDGAGTGGDFGNDGDDGRPHKALPTWAVRELSSARNAEVQQLCKQGIGVHHAGLLRSDRNLVERLFAAGCLRLLCCTATLAWGVNLPARTVVIKGTQVYDASKGGFVQLGILDVAQIFGRAGRPQFDSHGEGIILTAHDQLSHYLRLLTAALPIESRLASSASVLADHLNAELVSGTVASVNEAVAWLGYTFLGVRMRRNPLAYGVPWEELASDPQLAVRRATMATAAAVALDKARMAAFDPATGALMPTETGRVASHFYVAHATIEVWNEQLARLKPSDNGAAMDAAVLHAVASAGEFAQLRSRDTELAELSTLQERACPVTVKAKPDTREGKVNILLQAHLSRVPVTLSDMSYVVQSGSRLLRALFALALQRSNPSLAAAALDLARASDARVWPFQHPLRQLATEEVRRARGRMPYVPSDAVALLEETGTRDGEEVDRTSLTALRRTSKAGLEALLHSPARASAVAVGARVLPLMEVGDLRAAPLSRTLLRVTATLLPQFEWSDGVLHGTSHGWWVWLEDDEGERIYHAERLVLTKAQVVAARTRMTAADTARRRRRQAARTAAEQGKGQRGGKGGGRVRGGNTGASPRGVSLDRADESAGGGEAPSPTPPWEDDAAEAVGIPLVMTVPVFDPPSVRYWLRVESESWHTGGGGSGAVDVGVLALPQRIPPASRLLALRPLPAADVVTGVDPSPAAAALVRGITALNAIQSQVFHAVFHTDAAALLVAPPGSGRGTVAGLAALRAWRTRPGKTVVVLEPTGDAVSERVEALVRAGVVVRPSLGPDSDHSDGGRGSSGSGGSSHMSGRAHRGGVGEASADGAPGSGGLMAHRTVLQLGGIESASATAAAAAALSARWDAAPVADMVVATAAAWAVVWRHWSATMFGSRVSLLLFEHLHLLDEASDVELIGTRARQLNAFLTAGSPAAVGPAPRPGGDSGRVIEILTPPVSPVRLVATAAPVSSGLEMANWLGVGPGAAWRFAAAARPVPLVTTVVGVAGDRPSAQAAAMSRLAYGALARLSRATTTSQVAGDSAAVPGAGFAAAAADLAARAALGDELAATASGAAAVAAAAAAAASAPATATALIYVPSVRQVRVTGMLFIRLAAADGNARRFVVPGHEDAVFDAVMELGGGGGGGGSGGSARDVEDDVVVREAIEFGVGLEHERLRPRTRAVVRRLFLAGALRVLVSTVGLAWRPGGIRASLVVVQGTQVFDARRRVHVDIPAATLAQMVGRAGRQRVHPVPPPPPPPVLCTDIPGNIASATAETLPPAVGDTRGEAVVLVAEARKPLVSMHIHGALPVESALTAAAPAFAGGPAVTDVAVTLLAEVAAGRVASTADALDWLTWTFFLRRLLMNPSYYGLGDDSTDGADSESDDDDGSGGRGADAATGGPSITAAAPQAEAVVGSDDWDPTAGVVREADRLAEEAATVERRRQAHLPTAEHIAAHCSAVVARALTHLAACGLVALAPWPTAAGRGGGASAGVPQPVGSGGGGRSRRDGEWSPQAAATARAPPTADGPYAPVDGLDVRATHWGRVAAKYGLRPASAARLAVAAAATTVGSGGSGGRASGAPVLGASLLTAVGACEEVTRVVASRPRDAAFVASLSAPLAAALLAHPPGGTAAIDTDAAGAAAAPPPPPLVDPALLPSAVTAPPLTGITDTAAAVDEDATRTAWGLPTRADAAATLRAAAAAAAANAASSDGPSGGGSSASALAGGGDERAVAMAKATALLVARATGVRIDGSGAAEDGRAVAATAGRLLAAVAEGAGREARRTAMALARSLAVPRPSA